jgi:cystathionine beta-lyase/cystathionine gamma-synthase
VVTTTDELAQRVQFLLNAMGTCASPFDCWLVLRVIQTLPLRMKKHEAVGKVFYPCIKSHPGNEIAKKQMTGFGGVVSF